MYARVKYAILFLVICSFFIEMNGQSGNLSKEKIFLYLDAYNNINHRFLDQHFGSKDSSYALNKILEEGSYEVEILFTTISS